MAVATQIIIAQSNIQVILPYPVLCEGYTLILYRFGNKTAGKLLQQIFECTELINPTVNDYLDVKSLLEEYGSRRISYFDALLA